MLAKYQRLFPPSVSDWQRGHFSESLYGFRTELAVKTGHKTMTKAWQTLKTCTGPEKSMPEGHAPSL